MRAFFWRILVLSICGSIPVLASTSGCITPQDELGIERDREALVALFEAMDGETWRFDDNWLSDRPLREWYGVDTNSAGRVTRLHLDDLTSCKSHREHCKIPDEIGHLTEIEFLYLTDSGLSGSIPETIGALAKLERINLEDNKLSGPPTGFVRYALFT